MKNKGSNSTLFSLVQSIFASNSKWFTAYDTTVTTAARVTRLTASPTTSTRLATSLTIAQGRIAEGFGHRMDKSGHLLFICISTKTLSHACHPWSIQRSEIVTNKNIDSQAFLCPKLVSLENSFESFWNLKSSFEIWKVNFNLKKYYPVWKFISNMNPAKWCHVGVFKFITWYGWIQAYWTLPKSSFLLCHLLINHYVGICHLEKPCKI